MPSANVERHLESRRGVLLDFWMHGGDIQEVLAEERFDRASISHKRLSGYLVTTLGVLCMIFTWPGDEKA